MGILVRQKSAHPSVCARISRLRRFPQAYLVTQLHAGFNRLPLQGAQQLLRCF